MANRSRDAHTDSVSGSWEQALSPAQAVQCAVAELGQEATPPRIQRYLEEKGMHIDLPLIQQELADLLEKSHL